MSVSSPPVRVGLATSSPFLTACSKNECVQYCRKSEWQTARGNYTGCDCTPPITWAQRTWPNLHQPMRPLLSYPSCQLSLSAIRLIPFTFPNSLRYSNSNSSYPCHWNSGFEFGSSPVVFKLEREIWYCIIFSFSYKGTVTKSSFDKCYDK